MNLDHLGDALDHWKGSMIRFLRSRDSFKDLHVLPMITDPDPKRSWGKEGFGLYARLLDVSVEDILKPDIQFLPNEQRKEYFSLDSQCDLFIDPDTGIGNERPKKHEEGQRENYILPSEIASLIPNGSNRLLLIYQHSTNDNMERRKTHLRNKVNAVKRFLSGTIRSRAVFACFAGQTSSAIHK